MQENTDKDLGLTSEAIINACMVTSALESTDLALEAGLSRTRSSSPARCRSQTI